MDREPGMGIRIEPLTSPDELDALVAVEESSFTNPWTREMYLAELENPGASFLLLAKDSSGKVVGFCGFWRVLDELHINNLAVLPEYRRRGVASAILARVFAEGRALGANRTLLEVRRSNNAAQHLYESDRILTHPFEGSNASTYRNEATYPHQSQLLGTVT